MKTLNCSAVSMCRYCRYYNVTGRRGGSCQIFNLAVQGNWKACPLAVAQFPVSWKVAEEIVH